MNYDFSKKQTYSYFRAHDGAVLNVLGHKYGAISLSSSRLALHSPGGVLLSLWLVLSMTFHLFRYRENSNNTEFHCACASKYLRTSIFAGSTASVASYNLNGPEALFSVVIIAAAV